MSLLFEIENLRCSYDKDCTNKAPKIVLDIRRLAIPRGKRVFIVGESGIGKSTILETLGMMNNTMVVSPETKALIRNLYQALYDIQYQKDYRVLMHKGKRKE